MKTKLLVFIVLLNSCHFNKESDNNLKVFNLEGTEKNDGLRLSDLGFKSIRYIKLETNTESTISTGSNLFFHEYNLNKIVFSGNSIFFKNRSKIYKFDNLGTFKTLVSPIGRGPEEVADINDFDIEANSDCIYLLSSWQKKIKIYNAAGEFLKEIDLPFYCYEFDICDDKILFFCGNNSGINQYNYVVSDLTGNILKYFKNNYAFIQKSGYGFTHENLFYSDGDKLFKKEVYSDTIYCFEKSCFIPHLVISAGNRLITPAIRTEQDRSYICNNFNQPMSLFESGGFVFYQYAHKYNPPDEALFYGFIGSLTDDFSIIYDAGSGIINDLDGGPNLQPICTNNDREVVALIEPLYLKSYVKSDFFKESVPKYPEMKVELEKLADSLKETDNPVLILVK